MINSPCKCSIDLRTRITDHSKSLFDHTYVNSFRNNKSYVRGVIVSDLSDHYGTFIATPAKKAKAKLPKLFSIRDMRKFDPNTFLCVINKELFQLTLTLH